MFKKNISHKEILIAIVIYLISVPLVFQLLENQYISFGLINKKLNPLRQNMCEETCVKRHGDSTRPYVDPITGETKRSTRTPVCIEECEKRRKWLVDFNKRDRDEK